MQPAAMSSVPLAPPLDGTVHVIPGFVDFHAIHNPERPWVLFPSAIDRSVISISYQEFADATHRVAHALRPLAPTTNKPDAASDRQVVAVLVNCDTVLYSALLAGMVRAGLTPFPISPRNSAAAVVNMLKKTSCHRVVASHLTIPLISAMQTELSVTEKGWSLEVNDLPDLYDMFPTLYSRLAERDAEILEVLPYPDLVSDRTEDEPILYLHSSGSTGFPKPIPQSHRTMLEWCHNHMIGRISEWGSIIGAMALPTFHTSGIYLQLYSPLVTGLPVGLFTPQARPRGYEECEASPVVPSPSITLETAKRIGCTALIVVPTFVEIWAQSEEDVRYLSTMGFVIYAGGPLSERNGDKLTAAGVRLYALYGSTEIGGPALLIQVGERIPYRADGTADATDTGSDIMAPEDWSWVVLSVRLKTRWEPHGDGTYELHVLTCDTHHPAVENLPDVRGYATNDLWIPHPVKKGLWRMTGRRDDVIVLGSGEKVVPIQQEGFITSSPLVFGVVMFGRGHNQCGVLIEPQPAHAVDPEDKEALIKFRSAIWTIVEDANRIAPTFARIFKEMIIVTDPRRPLPRAAKGTIVRKQALALYDAEIEHLYQTVEDSTDSKGVEPPETWAVEDVCAWLAQLAAALSDGVEMEPAIDLFDQGFDSLHATFLRHKIICTLRCAAEPEVRVASTRIAQNFIFEHPTLQDLAEAISELAEGSLDKRGSASTADTITAMLERYSAGLPRTMSKTKKTRSEEDEIVVLLTGSTGNVGSHLLADLLAEPRISKVYTLNRLPTVPGISAVDRQRASFEVLDLPIELLSHEKYVPLNGSLNGDAFGLEQTVFEQIARTTTHVIHNAWKVDFNQSLRSFEPLVAGTRRLIDACYAFAQPVTVLFSSSEAVSLGWDRSLGPVPEMPLSDQSVASATGYGASKYIAEHLLARASAPGLSTVSLRIGQVCGAKTTGAWNTREWVPILVKSSFALGALPDSDQAVSWVPMDTVARAFVDLLAQPGELPSLINVVHPRPVSWRTVFGSINKYLEPSLPFISSTEWLARLQKISPSPCVNVLERAPAIKISGFLKGVFESESVDCAATCISGSDVRFDIVNLVLYSPTANHLGAIDYEHAASWVTYWKNQGFLNTG